MFYLSKHIISLSLLSGVLIWSSGCEGKRQPPPSAAPMVEVSHPVARKVTDYADYVGRAAAIDSVEVRARVVGYLQKVNFKEGELVKKGQVLFEIDPRPYQSQLDQAVAQLAQAQAEVKQKEANFARFPSLIKMGAASQLEYDLSLADRDVAIADVEAARARIEASKLNVEFCTIHSPIDGRISRYFVTVGNLIAQDQTVLTTIVSTGRIYAYFDVDDTTVLRVRQLIREGKATTIRDGDVVPVQLGLENEEGFPHQGQLNFADNQIAPKTGTLRMRGVFANEGDALQPGYFVRIRMPIGDSHPALLVPDRAIDTDQGRKVLRIVDEKNQVATRPVRLGALHDGLRVIEDGLAHDDRVIVHGLLQVRPGMSVEPKLVDLPAAPARAGGSPTSQPIVRTPED
jgi:RND family efflux transporter MFP subunit